MSFHAWMISEVFDLDAELARKMRGEGDDRGIIKEDKKKNQIKEKKHLRGKVEAGINGLEETFCTAKLEHNINDPSQADIYNPIAGCLTTINSHNLPILAYIRFSVQKGVLFSVRIRT
ncbi:hypothetical protein RCOM_0663200 [Ricinus communis]|uniref:Uncharacterized protein n=1 Tax=Ricinus communis TaxID=3988 RepID=B9SW14_RICCO|nr:hypothetical protein RCOM_0663200 [Ricinus communis]